MAFDLDNERTPEPQAPPYLPPPAGAPAEEQPAQKAPVPLVPVSEYLESLVARGLVKPNQSHLSRDGLAAAREHYAVVDERSWALPGCEALTPRPAAASWKLDLHTERRAPERVVLHCAAHNHCKQHESRTSNKTMVFGGLPPHTTVEHLRQLVRSQLLPAPGTEIVLESWGATLTDGTRTLLDYLITDDAKLLVRLVEREPSADRGLSCVRLESTALQTRAVSVGPSFTGLELKRAVEGALSKAPYEWWDHNGEVERVQNGVVLLAVEAKAAEEGGTDAVTRGEELIIDSNQRMALMGGKGNVTARRMVGGGPCIITEPMVAFVGPLVAPDKVKISELTGQPSVSLWYEGRMIDDADSLWELGVRTDDAIQLEFESPAQPDILKLLRGPDPPKKEKGKGKKKK